MCDLRLASSRKAFLLHGWKLKQLKHEINNLRRHITDLNNRGKWKYEWISFFSFLFFPFSSKSTTIDFVNFFN